jgi:hypothetical protein
MAPAVETLATPRTIDPVCVRYILQNITNYAAKPERCKAAAREADGASGCRCTRAVGAKALPAPGKIHP